MKRMVEYAPGMRIIVRGEEWMIKRVETRLKARGAFDEFMRLCEEKKV